MENLRLNIGEPPGTTRKSKYYVQEVISMSIIYNRNIHDDNSLQKACQCITTASKNVLCDDELGLHSQSLRQTIECTMHS